jgi:membrane protease YdiL (CAAX protease family)
VPLAPLSLAFLSGERGAAGPLSVAVVTTLVAVALSYGLPEAHAATGVGLCFLVAVYLLVLHHADTPTVRAYGLSLGGLFERSDDAGSKLALPALLTAAGTAIGWALLAALVIFPAFWLGYVHWYGPHTGFNAAKAPSFWGEGLGQLLGVAFPEEAFYRGYLQSALDRAWPPTRRWLGAPLGPSLWVSSALFAIGHVLTEPVPGRLAVFFPSLVFGFLRARTGGIGAALLFHALCNLFATYLGRSYGLIP